MEPINPRSLGAPRGYSNGMLADAGGRLLMIAGQIAWDEEQRIVSARFGEQFARALANVIEVVRAAGGEPQHLGQLTLYVTDRQAYIDDIDLIGSEYRRLMGRHFPTMALVEISGLLEPEALVEIVGLAVLPPE